MKIIQYYSLLFIRVLIEDARGYRADAGGELDSALDFVDACRRGGRRLLVHCDEGVNRAAAVAVAYLMDPGKGPLLFY